MTPQKINLLYFSPTGTTRRTLQNIAKGIALPVTEIDLTLAAARRQPRHFNNNELTLIAMPVYGGRLPAPAKEIFANLHAAQSPAALIVVYGNRHYDDALLELQTLATLRGFNPLAGAAFIAEHTFSAKVATYRPDSQDCAIQENFGRQLLEKFQHFAISAPSRLQLPGTYPPARPVIHLNCPPTVDDTCIDCGACIEVCPTDAINSNNPRNCNAALCLSCCACVKACTTGARRMISDHISAVTQRLETNFTTRREPELFF